jgi:uncharacterized membrane protein YbhN (UPF0104 family)
MEASVVERSAARGRIGLALGVVISVVAVAGVVIWAAGQPAPRFPQAADGWLKLAGALAVYAVATVVRGWRWDVILRHARVGHRRADALALTVVGYMGNTVLPARGGELLRIFLLGERVPAPRRTILGTIIAERLLDAAALAVVFAALTFGGVAGTPTGEVPAVIAVALVGLSLVAGLVYLGLRIRGRFQAFADRVRPVAGALRLLLHPYGAVLGVVSVGIWALEGMVLLLVGQALGLGITLPEAVFVAVLASLAGLVPAGPGYVGTYDAAMLYGLHAIHVPGASAVAYVLLFRFIAFVPVTAVGLLLLLTRYGGLGPVLRRARAR